MIQIKFSVACKQMLFEPGVQLTQVMKELKALTSKDKQDLPRYFLEAGHDVEAPYEAIPSTPS